jgi:hypothetical protein
MTKKEKHNQPQEHSNSNFWKRIWNKTDITAKTNIVLAFTSIVSLFLIYFMSTNQNELSRQALIRADTSNAYTLRGIKLAQNSSRFSDSITKKSLEISESSLRITRERSDSSMKFTKIDMRAFLDITAIDPAQFMVGRGLKFQFIATNSGRTPAYNVEFKASQAVGDIVMYDFGNLEDSINKAKITIGPGLDSPILLFGGKYNLILSDSLLIQSGKHKWYIWGILTYKDIFTENHRVKFCYEYNPRINGFISLGDCNETN